jgi:hypothetical protein
MNLHHFPKPARRAAFALALLAGLLPFSAQAQDAGKALGNLFQSLTRPNQPAQPAQAQPNSAAGLAGALLGASLSPGGQQAAQGGDLFQMLQQSVESIDEPKEIEIGRQLASVLLGSKPLHPDAGCNAM